MFTQKLIYSPLSRASLGATEQYNIYGVVIDATAPFLQGETAKGYDRYMVSAKIVDQSLNIKAAQILKDFQNENEQSNTFA